MADRALRLEAAGALRVGVDLIEVGRVAALVSRYGERFTRRVFTLRELEFCRAHPESLAARLAAKEAVSKALGTGIGAIRWRDVEVLTDVSGQPELALGGKAADLAAELGLRQWALSLSHSREHAIAFVVALG